ncbi:MAG TPA: PAS domain S-box protein [Myxococcota bacterium]|nr:PAS domain S-box protein [Myxococcota bacterium]
MDALARFRAWIEGAVAGDGDRGIPIAETVQWVSLVYGAGSLFSALAVVLAFPESSWRLWVSLFCVLLNAGSLWLVRRDHARAGAQLLVWSCWSSLLLALAMTRGVSIAAQSGLVLAICSAGLLLGRRTSLALAALSSLAGPVFGGLAAGLYSGEGSAPTFAYGLWLMQALIFFSAAALVSITVAHAERALTRAKRSESRFRALADNMQDVIIELDHPDRVAYANPAFLRRREIGPEQLSNMSLSDVIHPDDLAWVKREILKVRDSGSTARFTTRVLTTNGARQITEVTAGPITDADGTRRVVTVSRDVTAQRAIEDALRDSEERYRMLAEHAPDMITEFDEAGRMIYANRAAKDRGMLPERMADTPFGHWNHPEDVAKAVEAFNQTMATGRVTRLVHRALQKDGSYRWMTSSGAAFRTSKGQMRLVAQSRDISEELDLQEQLRQAQKMEAIGRLAGGVAHDFNNLLTVIGGYADVLRSSAADQHTQEAAREIGAAAERAAGLTRQLLALSRRQLAKSQVVDLNRQVRGLEPVLRRTLPERIELELVLDPDLPCVEADPSQLDQVLLNLALNARDAMPTRGRLRIETRRDPSGRLLHLLVSDTGIGMSEATRLRAFEPFFTTKALGEGTGLGLSTTYGIVRQAGGSISLDSAPGCGTRVVIELPAAQELPAGVTARPTVAAAAPAGFGAGVLVVEDDPSVRRLLTLLLESSGYRVFAAASGDEALRLADAGPLAVDLVLSDYVLPGISGVEVCLELRRRHPELRFVVMTGHAELPPVGAAGLPEGAELLGKPFTREQLEEALARQLAAA